MDRINTKNFRETQKAGKLFASKLKAGDVVLLSGELGVGKTTFIQGLAAGLGVKDRVISPTFILVRKHKIRSNIQHQTSNIKTLYHIDLYRLQGNLDIRSLGLDDIFSDESGLFLIEWGEKHEGLKANWMVEIRILAENEREIVIKKL